ncbi:MAG: hypothetical protein JXB62_16910 [Pirellulales bacterium]|nr:hypothetical protein [Pirellulales bacterium]
MVREFRLPETSRLTEKPSDDAQQSQRALKNLRYVLGSVNEDAQRAWSKLWEQMKSGVTPAGMVTPTMQEGFKPECGWAEFLEEFWLLKHYLDYISRLCRSSSES